LFFILIRSLFFITAFGFGICLVHLFYKNIFGIKIVYNTFERLLKVKKKLSLSINN